MSLSTGKNYYAKNYTYQHIQGIMLVNLNHLAFKANLSHSSYRLLAVLICQWKMTQNFASVSINELCKLACMSKSTLIRTLTIISNTGFIVILKENGKENKYFLSKQFFNGITLTSVNKELQPGISCKTPHDVKQNRLKQSRSFLYPQNYHDDTNINNFLRRKNQTALVEKNIVFIKAKYQIMPIQNNYPCDCYHRLFVMKRTDFL